MAVELTDLLQALADRLSTVEDLHGYPLFPPMNSLVFPAACIGEIRIGEPDDFNGTRTYELDVTLMVPANTPDRGQQLMWRYVTPAPSTSPYSVEAAIDADPSLGGTVQYAWMSTPLDRSIGATQLDEGAEVLGAKFTVSIWA